MKYMKLVLLFSIIFYGVHSYAYKIRNTYASSLVCIQNAAPHKKYKIKSQHASKEFTAEGKYNCKTSDGKYKSVCSVSEFQPIATFNTNDGSASCTTPERIK